MMEIQSARKEDVSQKESWEFLKKQVDDAPEPHAFLLSLVEPDGGVRMHSSGGAYDLGMILFAFYTTLKATEPGAITVFEGLFIEDMLENRDES